MPPCSPPRRSTSTCLSETAPGVSRSILAAEPYRCEGDGSITLCRASRYPALCERVLFERVLFERRLAPRATARLAAILAHGGHQRGFGLEDMRLEHAGYLALCG